MQRIKSLSIPKPCGESWQQMAPAEKGRHCLSCTKTVIDFTNMTNRQVIDYLDTNKNICGRFVDKQLTGINSQLEAVNQRHFSWKGLLTVASLITISPILKAGTQLRPEVEQPVVLMNQSSGNTPADSARRIVIKGKVVAKEDGQPLSGVSVVVKGTSSGTQTALNGSFSLTLPAARDTLVISYVGYKGLQVPVNRRAQQLNIALQMETTMLNEVNILSNEATQVKRCVLGDIRVIDLKKIPFYLRWWYWLKHQCQHIISAITPSFNE